MTHLSASLRLIAALLALAPACRSARYDPADLTIGPRSVRLEALAAEMVAPLSTAPRLGYLEPPGRPDDNRILLVADIGNGTRERIDRPAILGAIRTALLRSGRFRFTTMEASGIDAARLRGAASLIEPLRELGRRSGADVVLFGVLRPAGEGRSGGGGGASFQFAFLCVHVETGEVVWHDEQELGPSDGAGTFCRG